MVPIRPVLSDCTRRGGFGGAPASTITYSSSTSGSTAAGGGESVDDSRKVSMERCCDMLRGLGTGVPASESREPGPRVDADDLRAAVSDASSCRMLGGSSGLVLWRMDCMSSFLRARPWLMAVVMGGGGGGARSGLGPRIVTTRRCEVGDSTTTSCPLGGAGAGMLGGAPTASFSGLSFGAVAGCVTGGEAMIGAAVSGAAAGGLISSWLTARRDMDSLGFGFGTGLGPLCDETRGRVCGGAVATADDSEAVDGRGLGSVEAIFSRLTAGVILGVPMGLFLLLVAAPLGGRLRSDMSAEPRVGAADTGRESVFASAVALATGLGGGGPAGLAPTAGLGGSAGLAAIFGFSLMILGLGTGTGLGLGSVALAAVAGSGSAGASTGGATGAVWRDTSGLRGGSAGVCAGWLMGTSYKASSATAPPNDARGTSGDDVRGEIWTGAVSLACGRDRRAGVGETAGGTGALGTGSTAATILTGGGGGGMRGAPLAVTLTGGAGAADVGRDSLGDNAGGGGGSCGGGGCAGISGSGTGAGAGSAGAGSSAGVSTALLRLALEGARLGGGRCCRR